MTVMDDIGGRPRIDPGDLGRLGPFGWAAARIGARVSGTRDVHLFSTLGHARRLFPAWLAYSAMMMPFGVLGRRDTELVILRIAHLRGSVYERAHHERLGARIGLTSGEIARTVEDPATADWPERTRAMLVVADRIVTERDVPDAEWADVAAHLDDSELVGLVQLVTQYDGLATSLHVMRVQPDEPR